MFFDLRQFLDKLESEGELVRITKEVEAGPEISSILWELSTGRDPAVIFENVRGYSIPLVANTFASFSKFAIAFGLPKDSTVKEIRNYYARYLREPSTWISPVVIDSGPCKEVILKGDDVDLFKFPIFKWNLKDGGPYITLNGVVTQDPELGRNVGTYRAHVFNKNTTGLMARMFQDIGKHLQRAKQRGQKSMPVAITLGLNPLINIVATTKLPSVRDDEFALVGGMQGKPVELVKCETCDIEVPAHAEIIIEGELCPDEPITEGPFGEFMQYYEEPMITSTFHVKCITHRRNPLYQTCLVGPQYGEGEIIRNIPLQAILYNNVKDRVIGFRDCNVPLEGRGYKAIIQFSKHYPGWGKQAIYAAFSTGYGTVTLNQVTVVDEDIDIYDLSRVVFAEVTRVDPERDILLLPPMAVIALNPPARARFESAKTGLTEWAWCSKMGIDATKKFEEEGRATGELVLPIDEWIRKVRSQWDSYGLPSK